MNRKFRKLLSGVISSVGVMSSLVCPCVQAKWGEGTRAMTDKEFNAFYRKVGVDAFKYVRTHTDLKNIEASGKLDEAVDEFDKQNNLADASFSEIMGKYFELYQSSLGDKNKFSNCRVFSFMAIDYFQRNNIKSAYMQVEKLTFNNNYHDVVIYEGKDGEWFVADLGLFFSFYYCRFIKTSYDSNDFNSKYGFEPTNIQYLLKFPLRDYMDRYAKTFYNCIFASENSGSGGYRSCRVLDNDFIILPYWIKNSGACSQSFMDKFLLNESVEYKDFSENAGKLKFISPTGVDKNPLAQFLGGNGFITYKGVGGKKVAVPVA